MESILEIDKFHEETAAPIIMIEDGKYYFVKILVKIMNNNIMNNQFYS